MNLEDKTNNELMSIQKDLEMTHSSIKQSLLFKLDELENIEQKYDAVIGILKKRLSSNG